MRTRLFIFIASIMMTNTLLAANQGISDLFDDIGTTTATTPGSFRGQTMNHFVGGAVSYRVPQKSYQLASFSPPQLTAGCGGIDAYAGAFSFINSDQIVQMLQNIGNNAKGAIFKLAISSISPQLGGAMDFMETLAEKINALNINSCEAATGIVTKLAGVADTDSKTSRLSSWDSAISGVKDDWNAAKNAYSSGVSDRKAAMARAKSDPSVKDKFADVNITWEALKAQKYTSGVVLSDDDLQLLMSVFGTVICESSSADEDRKCRYEEPSPLGPDGIVWEDAFTIVGKGCSRTGSGNSLKCLGSSFDQKDIFSFSLNGNNYSSFKDYIEGEMNYLKNSISNRSAATSLDPNRLKRAYGLISMSSVPAWVLIKLSSLDSVGDAYYSEALKAIASDIAYNYMVTQASVIKRALEHEKKNNKFLSSEADQVVLQEAQKEIANTLHNFERLKKDSRAKLAQLGTVASSIRVLSQSYESRLSRVYK